MLLVFIFPQCKDENDQTLQWYADSPAKSQNRWTGLWQYDNTIWQSSKLNLYENNSFSFITQNCLGISFSKGEWSSLNDSIFLTSFDNFKQSTAPIFTNSHDTLFIHFANTLLQLKNDSLYYTGNEESLKGSKFSRTPKSKTLH